ncbi:hypothetical protein KBZ15_17195 [Cyanobium sp. BA20m-p-22]|nr:hypothetical protein [Cyanobium sp. BA20m-p-22]
MLPDGGPLLVALRHGQIEAGDVAVVLAILGAFEWKGGRCWAEWPDLAAATGMAEAAVMAATDRLQAAELLAVGRDADRPAWWFWVLHPLVVSDGRTTQQAERMRWAQWQQLLAGGVRPDDTVTGTRPRRLRELAREREAKAAAKAPAKTKPKPKPKAAKPKAKIRADRHRARPEVAGLLEQVRSLPRLQLTHTPEQQEAERQRREAEDLRRQQQQAAAA